MEPKPAILKERITHYWMCPHCKEEIQEKSLFNDNDLLESGCLIHGPCNQPVQLPEANEDERKVLKSWGLNESIIMEAGISSKLKARVEALGKLAADNNMTFPLGRAARFMSAAINSSCPGMVKFVAEYLAGQSPHSAPSQHDIDDVVNTLKTVKDATAKQWEAQFKAGVNLKIANPYVSGDKESHRQLALKTAANALKYAQIHGGDDELRRTVCNNQSLALRYAMEVDKKGSPEIRAAMTPKKKDYGSAQVALQYAKEFGGDDGLRDYIVSTAQVNLCVDYAIEVDHQLSDAVLQVALAAQHTSYALEIVKKFGVTPELLQKVLSDPATAADYCVDVVKKPDPTAYKTIISGTGWGTPEAAIKYAQAFGGSDELRKASCQYWHNGHGSSRQALQYALWVDKAVHPVTRKCVLIGNFDDIAEYGRKLINSYDPGVASRLKELAYEYNNIREIAKYDAYMQEFPPTKEGHLGSDVNFDESLLSRLDSALG